MSEIVAMGRTYKEQEEDKALSKNNGKNIRYRIRKQEEYEAKQEQQEAMKELTKEEFNTREDRFGE